jgi:hypothetical protein
LSIIIIQTIIAGKVFSLEFNETLHLEKFFLSPVNRLPNDYFCQVTNNTISISDDYGFYTSISIPEFLRKDHEFVDYLRKYLAFITTSKIEDWILIHGAALYKNHEAVILLGRSGAGKTTISRKMNNYDILDDDSFLLHENRVSAIGGVGYCEKRCQSGIKELEIIWRSKKAFQAKLFFFLSKRLPGGYYSRIRNNRLFHFFSKPDYIESSWSIINNKKNENDIDIPGFVIGTNNFLPETTEIISKLIWQTNKVLIK